MFSPHAISAFLLYFVVGLILLGIFTKVYMWTTPYDEIADIRAGKESTAITFGSAVLAFCFPLLSLSVHGADIFEFTAWAVIAGVIQIGVFKVGQWLFPDHEVESNNIAYAIAYAAFALTTGLMLAFSLIP